MNTNAHAIGQALYNAYTQKGLWGETNPAHPLPGGVYRGDDAHLTYLTLVYAVSGGRDPVPLWAAARTTFDQYPQLFDTTRLAYANPRTLYPVLRGNGIIRRQSEATVWQKTGQALMMRGRGQLSAILAECNYDALELWEMLQQSKTTFPVLSGPQTGPRWLAGLAAEGAQPLANIKQLTLDVSAAGGEAMVNLGLAGTQVSATMWNALHALGSKGCRQRKAPASDCPTAETCPVEQWCQWTTKL